MTRLSVSLENPQGNIKIKEGDNFNVQISVFRDKIEEGDAQITYNPNFIAIDFNQKSKPLPNQRSFRLFWKLIAVNKTLKPIQVLILITSGNAVQACAFNVEII